MQNELPEWPHNTLSWDWDTAAAAPQVSVEKVREYIVVHALYDNLIFNNLVTNNNLRA